MQFVFCDSESLPSLQSLQSNMTTYFSYILIVSKALRRNLHSKIPNVEYDLVQVI